MNDTGAKTRPNRHVALNDDQRPITHMIEVGAYPTRCEAERAQAALAVAGIPSMLEADEGGDSDAFDLSRAARLFVDQADAEAAAGVLADAS